MRASFGGSENLAFGVGSRPAHSILFQLAGKSRANETTRMGSIMFRRIRTLDRVELSATQDSRHQRERSFRCADRRMVLHDDGEPGAGFARNDPKPAESALGPQRAFPKGDSRQSGWFLGLWRSRPGGRADKQSGGHASPYPISPWNWSSQK